MEHGVHAGIPRLLREALTYAFDYDTLINVDLNDRVVRAGGMLGVDNVYYNSSVPLAYYNLTHARKVLLEHDGTDQYSLTQPWWPINFSAALAARGIDENSIDAEWQDIADHTSGNYDPILLLNFYWDDAHQELADTFERAANNLGVALVQDADNKMPQGKIIWDTVGSYWSLNFDGESSIWSASAWPMDYHMPATSPLGYIEANYADPDKGTWRTGYYPNVSMPLYWPRWNFGFSYDTEVDYWVDRAKYSDQAGREYWLNKIAEKEHNELYPMIYAYQAKEGRVLWNQWEMNFNRGDLFFANFRYIPPPPPPGDIALSSDAGSPDNDGNFNLIWNDSIGADNYSIYRYDSVITQINGSLDLISFQTATSPFSISGLTEGDYYFVAVAHNQSGDTMSNNIHITVLIPPPGDFTLSSDAGTPDIDGNFNLIWNDSIGADNYSIYRYDSVITQINGSLDLISYQTATSPFSISGLTDGEYYFVVVAHNPSGDTMSNNIQTTVKIPPGSFILSTDALLPDEDGIFNLFWTISDGADNYSLYMHNNPITVINSSLTLLFDQIITNLFPVSGLSNGEYYFVVLAHNKNGDTFSNIVHVTVNKPGGPSTPAIPGYNIFMILGIAIFTAVILFKRKKIKYKLR